MLSARHKEHGLWESRHSISLRVTDGIDGMTGVAD
jgi:hypothetical protein